MRLDGGKKIRGKRIDVGIFDGDEGWKKTIDGTLRRDIVCGEGRESRRCSALGEREREEAVEEDGTRRRPSL